MIYVLLSLAAGGLAFVAGYARGFKAGRGSAIGIPSPAIRYFDHRGNELHNARITGAERGGGCRVTLDGPAPLVYYPPFIIGVDGNRLRDAIERINLAWTDSGRAPRVHDAAKRKLQQEWRTLANAVEDLARLLK